MFSPKSKRKGSSFIGFSVLSRSKKNEYKKEKQKEKKSHSDGEEKEKEPTLPENSLSRSYNQDSLKQIRKGVRIVLPNEMKPEKEKEIFSIICSSTTESEELDDDMEWSADGNSSKDADEPKEEEITDGKETNKEISETSKNIGTGLQHSVGRNGDENGSTNDTDTISEEDYESEESETENNEKLIPPAEIEDVTKKLKIEGFKTSSYLGTLQYKEWIDDFKHFEITEDKMVSGKLEVEMTDMGMAIVLDIGEDAVYHEEKFYYGESNLNEMYVRKRYKLSLKRKEKDILRSSGERKKDKIKELRIKERVRTSVGSKEKSPNGKSDSSKRRGHRRRNSTGHSDRWGVKREEIDLVHKRAEDSFDLKVDEKKKRGIVSTVFFNYSSEGKARSSRDKKCEGGDREKKKGERKRKGEDEHEKSKDRKQDRKERRKKSEDFVLGSPKSYSNPIPFNSQVAKRASRSLRSKTIVTPRKGSLDPPKSNYERKPHPNPDETIPSKPLIRRNTLALPKISYNLSSPTKSTSQKGSYSHSPTPPENEMVKRVPRRAKQQETFGRNMSNSLQCSICKQVFECPPELELHVTSCEEATPIVN